MITNFTQIIIIICAIIMNISASNSVVEMLETYSKGSRLNFGAKLLTKGATTINSNLLLTLSFPEYQYQCKFIPVVAPKWQSVWYWCNVESVYISYCDNFENNNNGFSITITNDNGTAIFVDVFAIQTDEKTIFIEHFTIPMDIMNEEYKSILSKEYLIEGSDSLYEAIIVKQTSVSIDLINVINETAYNMTIINDEIDICFSDRTIWFIFVANEATTWQDAEDYCQNNYGTHLATIDCDAKMRLILELMSNYHIVKSWIGLKRIDGKWVWIDGTSCWYVHDGECKNDPNWASGEPNYLPGELCAHVGRHRDGNYNDVDCWMLFSFFCNFNQNASMSCSNIDITSTANNTKNVTVYDTKTQKTISIHNEWVQNLIGITSAVILCGVGIICCICYCRIRGEVGSVRYSGVERNETQEQQSEDVANEHESVEITDNSPHVSSVENNDIIAISINGTVEIDAEMKDKLSPLVKSHGRIMLTVNNNNEEQANTSTKSNEDMSSTPTTGTAYSGTKSTIFDHLGSKSSEHFHD